MTRLDHLTVRFSLPPSLGEDAARGRAERLEKFLSDTLHKDVSVGIATSYDSLAKDLLAGRVDAAWAPPFVCARIEAMGVRVLLQGVRQGVATYRAALVARADAKMSVEKLPGTTAAWVDKDSTAGYLLAAAYLKRQGLEPQKTFFAQNFVGSYRAAVQQVLEKKADVTSIFSTPIGAPRQATGLEEVAPERMHELTIIAFTDEAPNDGLAVSMVAENSLVNGLQHAFLGLERTDEGSALLKDIFRADRFEEAPRMAYRALYRVALASV